MNDVKEIIDNEMKNSKVTRNVVITEAAILIPTILIFPIWDAMNPQAMFAFFGALIIAAIIFVLGHILAAVGFFIAKRKREGSIILICFGVFTLLGLVLFLAMLGL